MNRPIVWTVAGSDSGGGAGIQADIKTVNALGAYACSVITAVTAQNTQTVKAVEYLSADMVQAQLDALLQDFPPDVIKLGMLGGAESIDQIAQVLTILKGKPKPPRVVYDPVMISTSGHRLSADKDLEKIKQKLFPWVDLLTPNLFEAQALTGQIIQKPQDMIAAAQALLASGLPAVLIKGGHLALDSTENHQDICQDYFLNRQTQAWLNSFRQESRNTHGTGCTLSSAIAAALALNFSMLDAVVIGKAYVNQGIRLAPELGQGAGPLAHLGWPQTHQDIPWITNQPEEKCPLEAFPDCGELPLGLYPVVDRAHWLEKLLPLGVTTVQLRIKDLTGEALELEIAQAAAYARSHGVRFFINDHWEIALRHQVYGVHLGQEDLNSADIEALRQSGIRLGISTHCYAEVARALAIKPSYIAVGPVFHTTTKVMKFVPQGLEALKRWRRTLPYPLVAIGGIFLENAQDVLETGVDGIATVRDIVQAKHLPEQIRRWQLLFEEKSPIENKRLPTRF